MSDIHDERQPRRIRGWLLGIVLVTAGVVIAALKLLVFEETRYEMDLHSGRTRTVHRTLITRTETVEDTWISETLRAVGRGPTMPSWMIISQTQKTLWSDSIGCNLGLPYDGVASMLGGFADRFSPEAFAMIAEDVLAWSGGPSSLEEQWRPYEHVLLRAAMKAKDGAVIDVRTVESIRGRALAGTPRP